MKTTFEEKKINDRYPCLRKSKVDGAVVLFFTEKEGIAIPKDPSYVGNAYYHHWVSCKNLEHWEVITGTVTFDID